MLDRNETALIIIDIQGTLARTVSQAEVMHSNWIKLLKGAQLLGLPIVVTEQNPQRLGPTIPELQEFIEKVPVIGKMSFSACLNDDFSQKLKETGKKQLLLAGIEAHVCVHQTVAGLLEESYDVHVVSDAVSSRAESNRQIALQRMRDSGAVLTSTEMALFEMMEVAEGDMFKQFVRIVK